jgi:2-polyprenyl-6-methoxyphenol hydroxylase-like FAD-dependent oxidoreductase
MAGEGTGLAMAEAYVLAAALRACGDQPAASFARYQDSLMPFLRRKQDSAARFASAFVPRTALGISYRNVVTRLMRVPPVADFFIGRDLRDDFTLPDPGPSIGRDRAIAAHAPPAD